jgi:hypothetical protein
MKKRTLIAAVVTPVVCASTGIMIGRAGEASADASDHCMQPTVYVDMAEGVSMITGGPDADANCDNGICTVAGAAQVEVNAFGEVQCVDVNAGQSLSVTRRSDGSMEITAR